MWQGDDGMATTIGDTPEARWADDQDMAFLSFSLGPVQTFIEAARSIRDLWTGSYLLSYLTFQAMLPILNRADGELAFVFPAVKELPLWKRPRRPAIAGEPPTDKESLLMPCTPNKFIAVLPREEAGALAKQCEDACHRAWSAIADKVWRFLDGEIQARSDCASWDHALWNSQVLSFFEVRSVVLPWRDAGREAMDGLVGDMPAHGTLWAPRMKLLAGLMEATRSVRHVPNYHPEGRVPQKCTLLGSYEQMGPGNLSKSRTFWEQFSQNGPYEGTRTDPKERLCAISLVKRFAWPAYLAPEWEFHPTERRFADSATIAAARWLSHAPAIDPETVWNKKRTWSGQWLHWKGQDDGKDDGEANIPGDVWKAIGDKRRNPAHPALPAYYGVLMLDGDHMGRWLQGRYETENAPLPPGELIQSSISAALGRFAVARAPAIVEGEKADHQGTLVYSGGDDVLAMLPTETILACAAALNRDYKENWPKTELRAKEDATVSAGIAVAHYKEDLRYVLQAARDAEKAAKNGGRDALALTICRRSGEHTTAILPWDLVGSLQELVEHFRGGASDRWAYALRAELPTLKSLPAEAFEAEVHRLIGRMEDVEKRGMIDRWARGFFPDYRDRTMKRGRNDDGEVRRDFVALCQSASFLARGRDER